MTRFLAVLPLVVLAAPVALRAQAPFEGTLTVQVAGGKTPVDMLYSVKGDRIRADMTAGPIQMYMLRQGDKNDMVIPKQKMYIEQSIAALTAAAQGMQGRGTAENAPKITRTGKKEKIAGYECEHVIVSGKDGDMDACLAQGLGTFMAAGSPMGGQGPVDPMTAALAKVAGFPLKMQRVGGETLLLVTNIEKKPLDESLFTIPSDYKKMDMGGMMGRGRPPAF